MTTDTTIFGLHAVHALMTRRASAVKHLMVQHATESELLSDILHIAKSHRIAIEYTSRRSLDHLTHDGNHQGVLAYCKPPRIYTEDDLKDWLANLGIPPFLLILDGIQDPHNLGACFRSADAAGVHAIIAPKDKACGITEVVAKVASGASEFVPFFQVTNLVRTMTFLKEAGVWFYGAVGEATQSLYHTKLVGPIGIVLGQEGNGLRRLTRESCDFLIHIPMHGAVSSLNVSVAAGVILFEAVRQRMR
ncbi:MAG: 23S rRNA (guanosine(2251)-2'-O)-methyltransferase RlmB [Gammaproteobacteria bacterium RIFCSPHIGHO2_12_FULL_42_10]|nr:MAG: 23S rRNA (guanosine(2251)-2'-O)-methyltransferase RlmB [Gammaproteobacteria bacterium RIFCSPHIGHO2_12_FULL_42_10]